MLLVAKSSCSKKQLEDRYSKGFSHIELQLTKEFLEEDVRVEDFYKDILDPRWNILSVHMPLIAGGQDVDLEFFSLPKYRIVFKNVCKLTQKCAEYYNHPVSIIIHSSFTLRMYELIPVLFDYIKKLFSEVIFEYPDITFSFENVFPINLKDDHIFLQNNVFLENEILVKFFNNYFKKNIFFSTLDICHLLGTLNVMKIFEDEQKYKKFNFTIEDYFKSNLTTINNIHFNNIVGCGLDKMKHSAKFDKNKEEDVLLVKYLLSLYKKYNYTCPLTLEIDEEDYENAILAKEAKDLILEQLEILEEEAN